MAEPDLQVWQSALGMLDAMAQQVSKEDWDALETMQPELLQTLAALPVVDWSLYAPDEARAIALYMQDIQNHLLSLSQALQGRRQALTDALQGLAKEAKIRQQYRE